MKQVPLDKQNNFAEKPKITFERQISAQKNSEKQNFQHTKMQHPKMISKHL